VTAYTGLEMHDVKWFREVFLELIRTLPANKTDLFEEPRQGRFLGKGRYASFGANDLPPLDKILALRAGRCLLRQAGRLLWAWKRKFAVKMKSEQG